MFCSTRWHVKRTFHKRTFHPVPLFINYCFIDMLQVSFHRSTIFSPVLNIDNFIPWAEFYISFPQRSLTSCWQGPYSEPHDWISYGMPLVPWSVSSYIRHIDLDGIMNGRNYWQLILQYHASHAPALEALNQLFSSRRWLLKDSCSVIYSTESFSHWHTLKSFSCQGSEKLIVTLMQTIF